jgi:hypothetical protein
MTDLAKKYCKHIAQKMFLQYNTSWNLNYYDINFFQLQHTSILLLVATHGQGQNMRLAKIQVSKFYFPFMRQLLHIFLY